MSKVAEQVTEFRGIVDGVIAQQIRDMDSKGVYTLGYKKEATILGLTFVSLKAGESRPASIGIHNERLWGVGTGKYRLSSIGRTAYMGLVSTESRPDSLIRRWSIMSSMQMINIPTELKLTEDSQMQDAIDWVRSPHLSEEAFQRLATLTPDEIAQVQPELARAAESQRKLDEDLKALDDNRRRAWENARDIIIG